MEHKCEYCGKGFISQCKDSKYCSKECRDKALSKKIECKCCYCGAVIYRKPSDLKGKTKIYCSQECHFADKREEVVCLECGKTFIAKKSLNRKFCSIECRQKYLPTHQKMNRENFICKNCGNAFEGVKSAERVFCSVECFQDYQKNKKDYSAIKIRSKEKGKKSFYDNKIYWHPNIQVLGEYEAMRKKIECKCIEHNNIFEMYPVDILRGENGCKECYNSVGENLIASCLDDNNILYERQKTFDDCKYKNVLRFDFYIESMNIIIEYDGEQHFKPVTYGGLSEEEALHEYNLTRIRDKIKNEYCKKKGIELIRIPYYERKTIPTIINNIIC